MARVVLRNVFMQHKGSPAPTLKDINLICEDKEFMVIVGPSGCGKSTTLRLIAGLEEITKGEIYIDDRLVNDVPPKDRDIAMVFQNYALYPHMNAYGNMAFALKLKKFPEQEIRKRVIEAADILKITHLLGRRPAQLSGGERQRVAVGRAIVRKPKVFLFDEPLSNLDAERRAEMRVEISKLHNRLNATMIYVTHDQIEAQTMGDRIVVLSEGVIQQMADPMTLFRQPCNKFVASFIGTPRMNFMEGKLLKQRDAFYFEEKNFAVRVADDHTDSLVDYLGRKVIMGIRPGDIYDRIYASNASPDNTITTTVEIVEPMGDEANLYLAGSQAPIIVHVNSYDQITANQDIDVVFDMSRAHFFDLETQQRIM